MVRRNTSLVRRGDKMANAGASTFCVLCYDTPQAINFTALASALRGIIDCNPTTCSTPVVHYDDLFVCDFGDMRLGIAHCDLAAAPQAGGYRECLMIVASSLPHQIYGGPDAQRRKETCTSLMERVEKLHPADEVLLIEVPRAFSSGLYDQVLDTLWPTLSTGMDDDNMEFYVHPMAV